MVVFFVARKVLNTPNHTQGDSVSKNSFTDVISGALGFGLVATLVITYAPDYSGATSVKEEIAVGETILVGNMDNESLLEGYDTTFLEPAATPELIALMTSAEPPEWLKDVYLNVPMGLNPWCDQGNKQPWRIFAPDWTGVTKGTWMYDLTLCMDATAGNTLTIKATPDDGQYQWRSYAMDVEGYIHEASDDGNRANTFRSCPAPDPYRECEELNIDDAPIRQDEVRALISFLLTYHETGR